MNYVLFGKALEMLPHNNKLKMMFQFWAIFIVVFALPLNALCGGINGNNSMPSLAAASPPVSDNEQNVKDTIASELKVFGNRLESDDHETRALLSKWESYLESASHFSNSEYLAAIKRQQIEYHKAITKLNERIKETNEYKNKYSSKWVTDLKRKFGKDGIKNKRSAILDNFGAIISRSYHLYGEELKNLIYIEAMLHGSYKEYLNKFLDFYGRELDDLDRKRLNTRKEVANSFLSQIGENSYTFMHENLVLREKLEETRAQKHDNELYVFFKEHPLSMYFDISKAGDDLEIAIQGQNANR